MIDHWLKIPSPQKSLQTNIISNMLEKPNKTEQFKFDIDEEEENGEHMSGMDNISGMDMSGEDENGENMNGEDMSGENMSGEDQNEKDEIPSMSVCE